MKRAMYTFFKRFFGTRTPPVMTDAVTSLKHYIELHADEQDGGRWEYLIHPEIRDTIDAFNEAESALFSQEIFSWDEKIRYHVADAILFGNNPFLEQEYLYCQIFLKTTDPEKASYLSDNLFACYNAFEHETKPLAFFLEMKTHVKRTWNLADDENYFILAIDETIRKKSEA